jgi:hypothetical protein
MMNENESLSDFYIYKNIYVKNMIIEI